MMLCPPSSNRESPRRTSPWQLRSSGTTRSRRYVAVVAPRLTDQAIADTKLLAKDDEMKDLVQGELASLREQRQRVLQDIPAVLLPPPRNNTLPAMLSLNAGVGGDEATLCTAMIMRMYQRFAEIKGWTVEVMSMADGGNVYGHDGVKEVTMKISAGADEVYGQLQWESGVHRVQRVPPNDAKGRIQTSTLSVIVSLVSKGSKLNRYCP